MNARLVLIDGLPGCGKSSLARALGEQLPEASVYFENYGTKNPLHAFPVEEDVAEFAAIYDHPPAEVRRRFVEAWKSFAENGDDGLHIVESHPFQSAVRLLLQMDAGRPLLREYMDGVERASVALQPRLIMLRSPNGAEDLRDVMKVRGEQWSAAVCGFVERTPWARNRSLSGYDAAFSFIREYQSIVDDLVLQSTFPTLYLTGGKALCEETVSRAMEWICHPISHAGAVEAADEFRAEDE